MTHIYQFISVIFFSVFFVQALVRHNRKQQCYHFSTEFYVAAANSLPISPASQPAVSRRHTIFEIRHYNRQINNTYAHHSIGLFLTTMVLVMTTALIGPMQKKKPVANSISIRTLFFSASENCSTARVCQVRWHIKEVEPHTWALSTQQKNIFFLLRISVWLIFRLFFDWIFE